jgi:hypothetical protein
MVDGVGEVEGMLVRERWQHREVVAVERGGFTASGGLHMGFDLKRTVD